VHAAYCYRRVAWSVGLSLSLSVTVVSPAKTVEPIEMPFGLRMRLGQGTICLIGVYIPPWKGQF